jgi:hypothetical protein
VATALRIEREREIEIIKARLVYSRIILRL